MCVNFFIVNILQHSSVFSLGLRHRCSFSGTYFVFVNFISSVYLVLVFYYLVSNVLIQLSVPCGLIVLRVVFI